MEALRKILDVLIIILKILCETNELIFADDTYINI